VKSSGFIIAKKFTLRNSKKSVHGGSSERTTSSYLKSNTNSGVARTNSGVARANSQGSETIWLDPKSISRSNKFISLYQF